MKVSVIIPCHNVAGLLPQALRSVHAQTLPAAEVVVVDDGSTDGTWAVIEEAMADHPGLVRGIRQENRGACAARNAGLRACSGEWVQFLDADDELFTGKLEGQAPFTAEADIVVGDYEQVMPDGLLLTVEALYDRPWMALVKTRMGTTSANLWRRAAVEAAEGWDEDLASSQDYELLFRMLRKGARVAWDRQVATRVLKRVSGSISRTDERANWERYVALRKAMKDHLLAQDPSAYAEEVAAIDQYLFMALRILATYDLDAAVAEFRRSISPGFVPHVGRAITERYVLLYNLLGFAGAEKALRLRKGPSHPAP